MFFPFWLSSYGSLPFHPGGAVLNWDSPVLAWGRENPYPALASSILFFTSETPLLQLPDVGITGVSH